MKVVREQRGSGPGRAPHWGTAPRREAEPLSLHRFLRHVPVVYVDYPGPASLTQIYGTFNRAMLRLIPSLRTYAEPLTAAMVEFYTMSQVLGLPRPRPWAGSARRQSFIPSAPVAKSLSPESAAQRSARRSSLQRCLCCLPALSL